MKFYFLVFSLLLGSITLSQSNLQLPEFFSDNMVLQRESEVTIWGKCKPKTQIIISAGWNESATAKTDENGNWKVSINTIEAGGPYSITVSDGTEKKFLKNILLGEVWLCSGQSNMEMPLGKQYLNLFLQLPLLHLVQQQLYTWHIVQRNLEKIK